VRDAQHLAASHKIHPPIPLNSPHILPGSRYTRITTNKQSNCTNDTCTQGSEALGASLGEPLPTLASSKQRQMRSSHSLHAITSMTPTMTPTTTPKKTAMPALPSAKSHLNLLLHILDGVTRLNIKSDGLHIDRRGRRRWEGRSRYTREEHAKRKTGETEVGKTYTQDAVSLVEGMACRCR
jgi:hypothetical protein